MLDPAQPVALNLENFDGYLDSCRTLARERLAEYKSLDEIAGAEKDINQYPRLDDLTDPRDVAVLDGRLAGDQALHRAARTLLEGGVLLEHTCAGEATRLGLGTKYLLNPARDFTSEVLRTKLGLRNPKVEPAALRPLSLGRRHMLQLAWDLSHLAREHGLDPSQALADQTLLITINQASGREVLADFQEARFYGFDPAKVLFMVQASFHGFSLEEGGWFYNRETSKRLHNHGQMLMQTTMDGQVFRLAPGGERKPLSWPEYLELVEGFEDKISFNIEDLDYLDHSLDLEGLAAALVLGDRGAGMVMEVVANDPETPQKGGSLMYDPELGRNVMIESFQLKGLSEADIRYLNKNINHYPRPGGMLKAVRERGLSMPIAVKGGALYFQPVQGDANFLLETAYLRRPEMKSIRAWKSAANTNAALQAFQDQDRRPGFLEWSSELTGLSL